MNFRKLYLKQFEKKKKNIEFLDISVQYKMGVGGGVENHIFIREIIKNKVFAIWSHSEKEKNVHSSCQSAFKTITIRL